MGRAIALALAARGADVALHWYRDEAPCLDLAARIGAVNRRAVPVFADLGEAAAARAMVDADYFNTIHQCAPFTSGDHGPEPTLTELPSHRQ